LEDGIIDRVACVTPNDDPDRLFGFAIVDNAEDIRRASGSCYYPVEMGTVVKRIRAMEGRYAITGLPCFLKGVCLAMQTNRRLRGRIVALIGLVCGRGVSKFYAEYVAATGGGDPYHLTAVQFRTKDPQRSAADFGIRFECQAVDAELRTGTVFMSEGLGQVWSHDYFKPRACDFCDDVFAEVADVVFMDAWLPGYRDDPRGHSLVINRNPRFKKLWDGELSGTNLNLERIGVEQVIQSQRPQLLDKREAMQYRCEMAQRAGVAFPQKRWAPKATGHLWERWAWRLRSKARCLSSELWSASKELKLLDEALRWTVLQLSLLTPVCRGIRVVQDRRLKSFLQGALKYKGHAKGRLT
jgi:coenzyme F420-reducing hydrogenase beta subunit